MLQKRRDLRQIHDKVVSVCLLGCFDNVLEGHTRSTITYVLSYGSGEQHRFLLYNTNQRAQPLDV